MREHVIAAGEWLHTARPWNMWATLTFRYDVSDAVAKRVLKDWLRAIAETTGEHVWFAYGFGPQTRGVAHFHVLLVHPAGATANALHGARGLWANTAPATGNIKIDPYDPDRGAAHYQAKHPEWDVNVACPRSRPRCRRDYCDQAPSPW